MRNSLEAYWSDKRVLSIGSGILLGLSFPPLPFPFLLFPAWILLFRLAEITETRREAAYWSYFSFVIWNLITTYWLMMATLAGGIAAILANSAVMTVPFVLQREFQKKLQSPWLIALFQSAAWISYEFLHHHWDLAWPWLTLGNAWSNAISIIQYISVTGHLGISLWVLFVAAIAYQAIKTSKTGLAYSAIGIALLLPAISLIQYQTAEYPSNNRIEAVVTQPNFDTYHDYGGYEDGFEALDVLINLSDSLRTDSTDLIVWPESGIRTTLYSRSVSGNIHNVIKQRLLDQVQSWSTTLIAGAVYVKYFIWDDPPDLFRGKPDNPYQYYNAAMGFYADRTYDVYEKYNLVPVVERIPFVHFLDAIDIFGWVDWTAIQGYGKGKEVTPFYVDETTTPALICYDSVFPGWVREYVNEGAGFITIITNDGWWGDTSGHHQHFAYARLRAIEFHRWVVRSANNGISGIIGPYGNIEVKTDYWEKTAFRYQVPVLTEKTTYALWGDWLSYTMLVVTGMGTVFLIGIGIRFRTSESKKAD